MNDNAIPIYLQLAERLCDDIVRGRYPENGRIPSVRDLAVTYELNNITVLHTFDALERRDLIFKRRGEGYFVKEGAAKILAKSRKERFYNELLPQLFYDMETLGIPIEDVARKYEEYLNSKSLTQNEEEQK